MYVTFLLVQFARIVAKLVKIYKQRTGCGIEVPGAENPIIAHWSSKFAHSVRLLCHVVQLRLCAIYGEIRK